MHDADAGRALPRSSLTKHRRNVCTTNTLTCRSRLDDTWLMLLIPFPQVCCRGLSSSNIAIRCSKQLSEPCRPNKPDKLTV